MTIFGVIKYGYIAGNVDMNKDTQHSNSSKRKDKMHH